ncbi:unnamed protein product [Orchesella dallaii]|uniref:Uncharacterized protein n=1 Tax=Orchesella dallaii TaxID=48710 RepID=A0ABP1RUK9_9HEXA
MGWLIYIHLVLAISEIKICSSLNNQHIAVAYDPVAEESKESFTVTELLPQISVIATRFTKISHMIMDFNIDPHMKYDESRLFKVIPKAIATYNRYHLKAGKPPLELALALVISKTDNLSSIEEEFNVVQRSADDANSIYPKTVTKIYLENRFLFTGNYTDIDKYEIAVSNIFLPKTTNYEIGATLPLPDCELNDLPMFLRKFKHLAFDWYPVQEEEDKPVVKETDPLLTAEMLAKQFGNCKATLDSFGLDISIELRTSWLYKPGTEVDEHNRNLITYWNAINDWAVKINLTVVMLFAFDEPDGIKSVGHYSGWWQLKENVSLANISEDSFKEKIIMLSNNSHSVTFWILLFAGVFLILGVIVFASFKLSRRFITDAHRAWIARYFSFLNVA